MKNLALLLIISGCCIVLACNKETVSEHFKLLTDHTWVSDSLLAEGVDASRPGGILEKFKGEAKFNEDGSGHFGIYSGIWRFSSNETQIVIVADSLQLPMTTNIVELTNVSLKITTSYPNVLDLSNPLDLRLTFKAKLCVTYLLP